MTDQKFSVRSTNTRENSYIVHKPNHNVCLLVTGSGKLPSYEPWNTTDRPVPHSSRSSSSSQGKESYFVAPPSKQAGQVVSGSEKLPSYDPWNRKEKPVPHSMRNGNQSSYIVASPLKDTGKVVLPEYEPWNENQKPIPTSDKNGNQGSYIVASPAKNAGEIVAGSDKLPTYDPSNSKQKPVPYTRNGSEGKFITTFPIEDVGKVVGSNRPKYNKEILPLRSSSNSKHFILSPTKDIGQIVSETKPEKQRQNSKFLKNPENYFMTYPDKDVGQIVSETEPEKQRQNSKFLKNPENYFMTYPDKDVGRLINESTTLNIPIISSDNNRKLFPYSKSKAHFGPAYFGISPNTNIGVIKDARGDAIHGPPTNRDKVKTRVRVQSKQYLDPFGAENADKDILEWKNAMNIASPLVAAYDEACHTNELNSLQSHSPIPHISAEKKNMLRYQNDLIMLTFVEKSVEPNNDQENEEMWQETNLQEPIFGFKLLHQSLGIYQDACGKAG